MLVNRLWFFSLRAGHTLEAMYKLPAVQSFLNGVSAKELFGEKEIYQHGSLRKVALFLNCCCVMQHHYNS